MAPLAPVATKTLRDRITIELKPEDRRLLEQQRNALALTPDQIADGQLILGVYRRFAGAIAKPARK